MWSMPSFAITNNANGVLADGYLVVANGYDNQLYCYGTGQSATTVSAPDTAIPQGTPVLIQGTVTDQFLARLRSAFQPQVHRQSLTQA